MKAKRGDIERALAAPSATRLFLLHGADVAGSHALLTRLVTALGPNVERIALASMTLKANPGLLADEAAAFSLFGERRAIVIDGGGEELVEAVTGLLSAPIVGSPVVVIAGALKKTSKLLELVESSPVALATASYVPEGRDLERMVVELGNAAGLDVASDLARRIAKSGDGDRRLISFEIEKFALYLDAAPDRRATLDVETLDALSADADEGDLVSVVDNVLDGDVRSLNQTLMQSGPAGVEPIMILRALARRVLLLAKCRCEVDSGQPLDAVMASTGKSVFFKERAMFTRQLGIWSSDRLARLLERILKAEREFKATGSLGADATGETLFAVTQAAARRR